MKIKRYKLFAYQQVTYNFAKEYSSFNNYQYGNQNRLKEKKVTSRIRHDSEEFIARVRKAEEGPFYTLEEIKQKMQEWKGLKFNPAIEGGELTIDEFKSMVKSCRKRTFLYFGRRTRMIRQWREQRRNR